MVTRLIAKVAILFCGVIVAGVLLNLYVLPLSWVTIVVLGIKSQVFFGPSTGSALWQPLSRRSF
jgi:hypothetical protein